MTTYQITWPKSTLRRHSVCKTPLKIIFINPPIRWFDMSPVLAWISMKSYYQHYGKYQDSVEWLDPVYKWDQYQTVEEVYMDCIDADVYLFSSYVWNYDLCDKLAAHIKQKNPNAICLLGGPMIGTNDKEMLSQRTMYDYILQPTQPGEPFLAAFIDSYFDNNGEIDIQQLPWELRSTKTCSQFMPDYSVYEENKDLLVRLHEYAVAKNIRFNISFETTRGCPFKCTFCEWGGGIGSTKIIKKPLDVVEKDMKLLQSIGFTVVESCDANFGIFKERDLEIFQMAWDIGIVLTGISAVKLTNYEKKKELLDNWFDIIVASEFYKTNSFTREWDVVPILSMQTASELAIKNTNRVDLSAKDKLKLAEHCNNRRKELNLEPVATDFILGMPGSTVDDFYSEYEIMWKLDDYLNSKYIYMILPDTEVSHPDYLKKHNIELVKVNADFYNAVRPAENLYKNRTVEYYTISSCSTLNKNQRCEIWIMNFVANDILKIYYQQFQSQVSTKDFMKHVWYIIKTLPFFLELWDYAQDLFDPATPSRNVEPVFLGTDYRLFGEWVTQMYGEEIQTKLKKIFH